MKKPMLILVPVLIASSMFLGAYLQQAVDVQTITTLQLQVERANNLVEEWQGMAWYYKFYLDKMTYDNQQAKVDIERLLEACARLQAERDVYYKALHECLNLP